MGKTTLKPIVVEFWKLTFVLRSIHKYRKADVDRLHDIWKLGAPSPDSRVLTPKGYDPRVNQLLTMGNREQRTVFPTQLQKWLKDIIMQDGLAISDEDALKLVGAIQVERHDA